MMRLTLLLSGIRIPAQQLLHVTGSNYKRIRWSRMMPPPFRWPRAYTALVAAALLVPGVNSIFGALRTPSVSSVADAAIFSMPPAQYVSAVFYFATDHFDQFDVPQNTEARVEDLLSNPCGCGRDVIALTASVTTVVYHVVAALFVTQPPLHPLQSACLAVVRTHGVFAIVLNSLCFAYVFTRHVRVLRVHVRIFEAHDWTARDSNQGASLMMRSLVRMRESLRASTELLIYSFASAVLLGCVAAGSVLHGATMGVTFHAVTYISISLFLAIVCLFFDVIYCLSESSDDLRAIVHSAKFADTFLQHSMQDDTPVRVRELSDTLDWYVIYTLLQEEWLQFNVMGMPLHRASTLKQIAATVAALLLVVQQATSP